jgi:hypothetical protein
VLAVACGRFGASGFFWTVRGWMRRGEEGVSICCMLYVTRTCVLGRRVCMGYSDDFDEGWREDVKEVAVAVKIEG